MFSGVVKPGDPDHPASIQDPVERLLAAKRFLLSKNVMCRQVYAVDLDSIAYVNTAGLPKTALLAVDDDNRLLAEVVVDGWPDPSSLPSPEE